MKTLIKSEECITDKEVADLYLRNPDVWVLLEALEKDKNAHAIKLKVVNYNKEKEVLRAYILDHDELDKMGTLIYFFTGHDGTCKF